MDIYATRERIRKENINFMNLPLRVTFYARVSTDFNVQLNSLDNQITYYTDFIRKNPNWEYVDGYVDEGISGVSTAKRERFNEMIEDAKAGMFDLIVTKEVSRFARNTLDSIRFTRELLASGVAVYFQNDNINTLDEDSELRLTIMSSMAQDESRKISTRVRFGHQQAIKKGTVLGTNNMYGYIKKGGKLIIDETQADFVRELFEMYATGKFSMKQMEKHFYQKGIRNSKGKMLSHSTMSNIIRNPKYKGYYAGNKVRITDLFTKKQKFLPEEEWVMYKDETGETVPAIVSEELWDKANEVLYMRSQDVITAQHKTVHQNLLTGKLICAHCGMPYYRKDAVSKGGEKISKWVCSGKIKNGASNCPSRAIYESEIKPIIEDIFKSGQQHIEELSACVLKLVSEVLDANENKDELNRLNQDLITRQKMKSKLLQYNADGKIDDDEFIRMTADCDSEIKEIESKINALTETSKTEQDMKKELANIKAVLKAAEQHIDGEEIDRAFIDRYISDITVYPDEEITRFEIHLKAGTTVTKALQNLTSRAGSNSKDIITAASALHKKYKDVTFDFYSGDATDVTERLDHGSLDFAVLLKPVDTMKYEYLSLKSNSYWGLLMPKNCKSADKEFVIKEDLCSLPLIFHSRVGLQHEITHWAQTSIEKMNIVATYNILSGNPLDLVKNGLGCLLTSSDHLPSKLDNELCFKELYPKLELNYVLVWKRNATLSNQSKAFLNEIRK